MDAQPDTVISIPAGYSLTQFSYWRGRDEDSGGSVFVRIAGGAWTKIGSDFRAPGDRSWATQIVSQPATLLGFQIGIQPMWCPSGKCGSALDRTRIDPNGPVPNPVQVNYDGNEGNNGFQNLQIKFEFKGSYIPTFP